MAEAPAAAVLAAGVVMRSEKQQIPDRALGTTPPRAFVPERLTKYRHIASYDASAPQNLMFVGGRNLHSPTARYQALTAVAS